MDFHKRLYEYYAIGRHNDVKNLIHLNNYYQSEGLTELQKHLCKFWVPNLCSVMHLQERSHIFIFKYFVNIKIIPK
jgi:hypothetical protein